MQRIASSSPASGIAQERHLAPGMRGRERQQSAQQEAVRSRHGSSRSQTTHHDGKSVRTASRAASENTAGL